jgi:hypothetical protein
MNKLISYLLAFYTIALACIPCQDEISLPLQDHIRTEVSTTHDHDTTPVADLCSPFCICACCAAITLLGAPSCLPEIAVKPRYEQTYFTYNSPFGSNSLNAIWQPPKNLV